MTPDRDRVADPRADVMLCKCGHPKSDHSGLGDCFHRLPPGHGVICCQCQQFSAQQPVAHDARRAVETCPHCKEGTNSEAHGGNDRCFHCDRCDYIGCMWTNAEKRTMLAALAAEPSSAPTSGTLPNSDRASLLAEVARLRGLIDAAEWSVMDPNVKGVPGFEDSGTCPWCSEGRSYDHSASCPAFAQGYWRTVLDAISVAPFLAVRDAEAGGAAAADTPPTFSQPASAGPDVEALRSRILQDANERIARGLGTYAAEPAISWSELATLAATSRVPAPVESLEQIARERLRCIGVITRDLAERLARIREVQGRDGPLPFDAGRIHELTRILAALQRARKTPGATDAQTEER